MVDTTPLVEREHEQEKKIGHRFCGCCCDSRRAVLVFNILNLIFYFINIILFAGASTSIGAFWAYYIVGAAAFALAIAGAVCYNRWLVVPAALWAEISLIITIAYVAKGVRQYFEVNGDVYYVSPVATIISAAIWQGLCAYANWTFLYEVNAGIMSAETYEREKDSCCCV